MAEAGHGRFTAGRERALNREELIYAERARRLGLTFVRDFRLGRISRAKLSIPAIIDGRFAMSHLGDRLTYIAAEAKQMPGIAAWLAAEPQIGARLRVATPRAIRAALIRAGASVLVRDAVNRLAAWRPDLSSRRPLTRRQIVVLIIALCLLIACLLVWPTATAVAVNLAGAAFFLGVSMLRFIAAGLVGRPRSSAGFRLDRRDDDDLPVYSILVPLYREARLVGDLVAALDRLDWPRDRLDIKLIIEADDPETKAAVLAAVNGPPYEVVTVPALPPRTKPKALAFALPFARGSLLTIYDAEDRPHPHQLREAHYAFSRADETLACLQAPLLIDNRDAGFLARLFALEYSALFDGLLPAFVELGLPLPLGGTSNHFRRTALDAVGGWDPFNVTEDADLGMRLTRFGYHAGTLSLPTYEEAPARLGPWLKQRTRWFKGWLQTWLVHMRQPFMLFHEIGTRQMLGFNLIGIGMIISVLVHPIYLATLAIVATDPLQLWSGGVFTAVVIGVNLFNLLAGYLAMSLLAGRTLALRGRRRDAAALIGLPLYWLIMSLAAYRAVWQLVRQPFLWEKTPHVGRRAAGSATHRRHAPAAHAATKLHA